MRMRPGRSVTSILPSGRNASDHGLTRPLAKVRTSSPPADDGNSVSSPRVPVAITNVAASRIAAVSADGHKSDRCLHRRPPAMPIIARCSFGKDANRKCRNHAGIGSAMDTLIESTVSVTTRHSDSAPIASEAAMALVSREDATGAGRLIEAGRAGRPYHGLNPSRRGRITRDVRQLRNRRWQYCGARKPKTAKSRQRLTLFPLSLTFGRLFKRT